MLYGFADCTLDTQLYTLQRAGKTTRLRPKTFQVCLYLIENRARVITAEELLEQIWPEQFVGLATLASTIRDVRQAVGDSRKTQHIIQTLRGRGYRFVALVTVRHPPPLRLAEAPLASLASPHDLPAATLPPCRACGEAVSEGTRFCAQCGQPLEHTPAWSGPTALPSTSLVGREQALATLDRLWQHVTAGQGQVIAVVGEAGYGKSYLLAAWHARLGAQPHTYCEIHCQPWGKWQPSTLLRTLCRQLCEIATEETEDTIRAQVSAALHAAGIPSAERADYLLHLLDISTGSAPLVALRPALVQMRLFATLRQLCFAASRRQPLLLVIDDLPWLDETSTTWLISLVQTLPEASIGVVVTCPPTYAPGWDSVSHVTPLPLSPFEPAASERLLARLAPSSIPEAQRLALLDQAAGQPLYLEEGARWWTESTSAADAPLSLPQTVEAIVTARLAHLPPVTRQLLESAAVLGPVGRLEVLQALGESAQDLAPLLASLAQHGWCTELSQAGVPTYAFTSTLRWEIIYAQLPVAFRHHQHKAAVRLLSACPGLHAEERAALLAYHSVGSEDALLALQALHHVATHAAAHAAHGEAVQALQTARELVGRLPMAMRAAHTAELLLAEAQSAMALHRFQEVVTLLETSQPMGSAPCLPAGTGRRFLLLSQATSHLGAWRQAVQYAHGALAATANTPEFAIQGQAYAVLAAACFQAENSAAGLGYSQQAIDLLAQTPEQYALGLAYMGRGFHALLLGNFRLALHALARADTLGATLGESALQAYAAWVAGWIQTTRGAWEEGVAACEHALALAPDSVHAAMARGCLGYARLVQGAPSAAVLHLKQAVEQMPQQRYPRHAALYTTLLAEAYCRQGQIETAETLARQSLTTCEHLHWHFGTAWAHRTLTSIAQTVGALPTAVQHGEIALARFAALSAHFEVGRTHLLLSELAQSQAFSERACHHVTEAYAVFAALREEQVVARVLHQANTLGVALQPHAKVS